FSVTYRAVKSTTLNDRARMTSSSVKPAWSAGAQERESAAAGSVASALALPRSRAPALASRMSMSIPSAGRRIRGAHQGADALTGRQHHLAQAHFKHGAVGFFPLHAHLHVVQVGISAGLAIHLPLPLRGVVECTPAGGGHGHGAVHDLGQLGLAAER